MPEWTDKCSMCSHFKNPMKIIHSGNWIVCKMKYTIKPDTMACRKFSTSVVSLNRRNKVVLLRRR